MSVGQTQRQKGATHREARSAGSLTKLAAMTGHSMSLGARGALIWGVALGALGAVYVVFYPFLENASGVEQMIGGMPQSLKDLVGFGAGTFSSAKGFLASEMLGFIVPLALSFFPMLAASSALAGAEEDNTMDVLMGNPLSRWQFVLSRFLSAAVLLFGIVAIMGALTWITAVIADVDLALGSMASASASLWALCIFFGGIALLLSAILHRRFLALAIPAALLIVMYFVDGLAGSVGFLDTIQPLSAFNYYGSAIQEGLDWSNFAVLTGSTAVFAALAVLVFQKRDIYQ